MTPAISPPSAASAGDTAAGASLASRITAQLERTMAAPGRAGQIWIATLVAVIVAAAAAYAYQLAYGLGVTAMREYVSWGVYITNFVFFIGISHAGTLISAILRVTNAEWRRSVTRVAEAITVFALMIGAPMVLVDLGRIDRLLNVIVHGRLNSPLLWDVCSIFTYITGSITFLYIAMIPDFALLKARMSNGATSGWRWRFYDWLSLGYRGTPEQKALLERAMHVMSVIIIPVAVSVHTVVSWIFGMTLRPGWHSTIFGPYFVVGAIYSGTAALIVAMAVFRKVYRLENLITLRQFRALGALLMALTVIYLYFTFSEYLTVWYGGESVDRRLLHVLMGSGPFGLTWWAMILGCFFVPAVLLVIPVVAPRQFSLGRLVVACLLINVGMWLKRYLIIVPTLMTPFIPAEAAGVAPQYNPTWVEWTITAGAFATFLLLFTLFAKAFPIVSVWETIEGVEEVGAEKIGVEVDGPPAAAPQSTGGSITGAVAGVVLVLAGLGFGATHGVAAEPQAQPLAPDIAISTGVEEGRKVIIATVTRAGQPVEGAKVAFGVERSFGQLLLGVEETLDDGTAAVAFPADLPAGTKGELHVTAEIRAPDPLAHARAQAVLPGGLVVAPEEEAFPRALWSPRAPLALVLTLCTLLAIVWSTYGFVLYQLIKLKRAGQAGEASQ